MAEETRTQSWWQTLPGMMTALAAVITAVTRFIVALKHDAPARTDKPSSPKTAAPAAPPTQSLNLSGVWRDDWNAVTRLVQQGDTVEYLVEGVSCHGNPFQSTGSGRLSGNRLQRVYQSNTPSQGNCSGTVSPDGSQISSTCTDSACGTFVPVAVRQ